MSASPNYRFNRNPQFSVNHISSYLATTNATQRTRVIREAKFPKKAEVAAYGQVKAILAGCITKPGFGRDDLEFTISRLESKARLETGYAHDEALRCIRAVNAFRDTFSGRRFAKYSFSNIQKNLTKLVEGVRINISLDAEITCEENGIDYSGGLVLVYSFSDSRLDQKDRLASTAGLILWALEDGQMVPLPRLCMAVDLAKQNVVKASASPDRFRSKMADSCREIATLWAGVRPPHDYDGPDWR